MEKIRTKRFFTGGCVLPLAMNNPVLHQHSGCRWCGGCEPVYLHTIRGLNIVQCPQCGLIYTETSLDWDYCNFSGSVEAQLCHYQRYYWPARQRSALRIWEKLEKYRQTCMLLDVGCGFGLFLNEARRRGWEAVGVEPAQHQADWGRQHLGLQVLPDLDSRELQPGQFDVITLWDVIEHVADPGKLLTRCRELLRPGGLLLVKTPDGEGLLVKEPWWLRPYLVLYRHLVYPANPLQHLYHFTGGMLEQLIDRSGFTTVDTDFSQDWTERVIDGRNKFILVAKYPLMWLAWRLNLPYEILVLVEAV